MFYLIGLVIVFFVFLIGILATGKFCHSKKCLKGRHVMITGGSSGIGLSVAQQTLLRGSNVTIIARDETKLKAAKDQLQTLTNSSGDKINGKIQTFSVDIGGKKSSMADVVQRAEDSFGPIYMLVNCAGFSRASKFEDVSETTARRLIDVNFFGTFFVTQEVVRSMKKADVGGVIVFVSSQGGLLGIYGFSAYAAAKGAVVKMAESLHMELKPYNISVTVSYPPDTDTPGFVEENKTKPKETELISESAGLFKAEEVASSLIEDALRGKFASSVGVEGFMLTTLCAGMGPVTDALSILAQIFLAGVFRSVSVFYLWNFDRIVANERDKRGRTKKSE